ncbi:MAG TPA: hypothetical protein VFI17_09780 [Solirubrobacterales bacterium]|nr:hypothetical protein [Solirubrobacterales bacterium]
MPKNLAIEPFEIDDIHRFEPLPRSNEVASGLAARIHDPAWALTRQWQFGEFAGQDAGSPVLIELEGESAPITHWSPGLEGAQKWVPYKAAAGPLDRLVEAEDPVESMLARVEGGAHFARLLDEAGQAAKLAAVVAALGFEHLPAADESIDLTSLLADAVPDAQRLARAIDTGSLPVAGIVKVAKRWREWWANVEADPGPDTFDPSRFEHQALFSVGGTAMRAEEYLGDGLDWFSVDADPSVAAKPAGVPHRFRREAIASPLRFSGLPADRFWEMEDAQIDLGKAEVGTLDTGRLLLIAFAEVYGNDWFLVPLEVPAGSLTTIGKLRVTDSFGRQQEIARAGAEEEGWNMFSVEGTEEGLLVMPSAPGQSGDPLETIVLARDELANLSWAIESEYTSSEGVLVNRRDRWLEVAPEPREPGELPAYAVQTTVPDYWLPLVPHAIALGSIRFDLVPFEQPGFGKSEPKGRLLSPETTLHEEEVPREGAVVVRRPVVARWFDGSSLAWTRREKNPGKGESSSGLAFDTARPSDVWP